MNRILTLVTLVALSLACDRNSCDLDACDLDGDGDGGTEADYKAFQNALGSSRGDSRYVAAADMDGNGTITVADFGAYSERCPLR